MSHCSCCDKTLTDLESTLRHGFTNEFLDTCLPCLKEISNNAPLSIKHGGNRIALAALMESIDIESEDVYSKDSIEKENIEEKDTL